AAACENETANVLEFFEGIGVHKWMQHHVARSGKIARPGAGATFLESIPLTDRIERGCLFDDNIGHPRVSADRARIKQRAIVDFVWAATEDFIPFSSWTRCRSFPLIDGFAAAIFGDSE